MQAGVGQVLEDDQLAAGDPAMEPPGEARRADEVARSEGDQRRSRISASAGLASCATTASSWATNPSAGCAGRPRTNSTGVSTNSGRSAYISGVKHHGKIPSMTTSATVGKRRRQRAPLPDDGLQIRIAGVPPAVQRQGAHPARMARAQVHGDGGSSDTPTTWARSIPIAPRNEATWSA